MPTGLELYVWILIVGLILVIIILACACYYKKYMEDPKNIKWKKAKMEAKMKQIE